MYSMCLVYLLYVWMYVWMYVRMLYVYVLFFIIYLYDQHMYASQSFGPPRALPDLGLEKMVGIIWELWSLRSGM